MKLIIKTIALLLPVILLFCGCNSGNNPELKVHVKTKAPIECAFLEPGSHQPKCHVEDANDFKLKEYRVWYPEELEKKKEKKYPLIIMCNGTGYRATRLEPLFRHLASWGFIVVGTEEEWSGKGRGTILSLRYILKHNQTPDSPFYDRIDMERIGRLQNRMACREASICSERALLYTESFKQTEGEPYILRKAVRQIA